MPRSSCTDFSTCIAVSAISHIIRPHLSVLLSVHVCVIGPCLHCNNCDLEKNGMEFCRRGMIWQQVMDRWRQRVAGQKYMVKHYTAFHLTVPKPSWHCNMFKHIWWKKRLVLFHSSMTTRVRWWHSWRNERAVLKDGQLQSCLSH